MRPLERERREFMSIVLIHESAGRLAVCKPPSIRPPFGGFNPGSSDGVKVKSGREARRPAGDVYYLGPGALNNEARR
jgi:hypothetical protein